MLVKNSVLRRNQRGCQTASHHIYLLLHILTMGDTDQVAHLKKVACEAIDSSSNSLHELSSDIWKHPELCFEEHYAHDRITSYLESHKFSVECKYVVDTAFRSVVDCGAGPNVAILCEYDALPDIGHACGHNLIAEVGVGASIGVKAAMDAARDTGVKLGKVKYL